jgi:hypothetical protein
MQLTLDTIACPAYCQGRQQPKGNRSMKQTAIHGALFLIYLCAALALDAWIFGPPYNY